jgi:16S rRNA processing protein RimM
VLPLSDDPARWQPGSRLIHENGNELVVENSRQHRDRLLVKFAAIDDRSAAEGMRGALFVSEEGQRELAEDEFWTRDLVGCTVVLTDGTEVGRIESVVSNPSQDLLVVTTNAGETLVPAVKEIVRSVDPEAKRVTIDPPEGLLNL